MSRDTGRDTGRETGRELRIVVLGLSITSSWGNGHATTFRSLIRALHERGHDVLFLERDAPWYAANRDMPNPPFCRTELYSSVRELTDRFAGEVRSADLVVVGSYVPEGVEVGVWVTRTATGPVAFYDIDTPVTLARLGRGDGEYLSRELIPRYALYLSFTGGPTLDRIEREYGSPMARPLYCAVDPALYYPVSNSEYEAAIWDLGYMGTYSVDRQPVLERLMLDAARAWPDSRMVVAGPQYPHGIAWPANVERVEHLPPSAHRAFYGRQRFTLNVTRADMVAAGYSPSVRLFEAAACGTPIISDYWVGLESFFEIGSEILVSRSADETLGYLKNLSESARREIGRRARDRVLSAHTAAHRAEALETYAYELAGIG